MSKNERAKLAARRQHLLGASFVFKLVEILGPEYANARKPPYEGRVLTVVGFEPRLKNDIIVRDSNGKFSLMPLWMAERAISPESDCGNVGRWWWSGSSDYS